MKHSWRQIKLARERAREVLVQFYFEIDKVDPTSTEVPGDEEARRENPGWLKPTTGETRRFVEATFDILSALSARTNPSTEALDHVRAALNRKVHRLSYDRTNLKRTFRSMTLAGKPVPQPSNPWTIDSDPIRQAAETLIEYLKQTAICGPVHTGCKLEGCNRIVFGGRGNKRFCSDTHRVEYWDYKRIQKTYGAEYFSSNRKVRSRKQSKTKKEK